MKNFVAFLIGALLSISANAQFVQGQVLTAAELNSQFALYTPLAGGTLTGPLTVPTLNTANAQITGGSINGSAIGQTTASAGTFTNLTANTAITTPYVQAGYLNGSNGVTVATLNGPLGPFVIQNTSTTSPVAGQGQGIKVCNCAGTESGWTANPGAGDSVAAFFYINSSRGNRIWSLNTNMDIYGTDATAWGAEIDLNNTIGVPPNPGNTYQKVGLDVASGGTYGGSAAITAGGTNSSNAWMHGLWFTETGYQSGSTLIYTTPSVSVDYGLDLSRATVNYQGVRVGPTPALEPAGIGVAQRNNSGDVALYLQRFTDTSPTGYLLEAVNSTNSSVLADIDAGGNLYGQSILTNGQSTVSYANATAAVNDSGGSNAARFQWQNNGTVAWNLTNTSSTNGLALSRYNSGTLVDQPMTFSNSTGIATFVDGINAASATFTGPTNISYANSSMIVNDSGGANATRYQWQNNGVEAWALTNTSSTNGLALSRYNGGVFQDQPITFSNSTGIVSFVDGISVSGTVSGTGFSNYLASPPAIGGTTAAAGTFTTLKSTGTGAMPLYGITGTGVSAPHTVTGSVALASGSATVTLSGSAVYTSSSSYVCTANDATTAAAVKVGQASGTSITFTGTSTDTVQFNCVGS
jgi:hypothetical protein